MTEEAGRLETWVRVVFKSKGSLQANQEELILQINSEGSLLAKFLLAQKPARTVGSTLPYSKSMDLKVNLKQKHPHRNI